MSDRTQLVVGGKAVHAGTKPLLRVLLDAGNDAWVANAELLAVHRPRKATTLSEILRRLMERGWLERRAENNRAFWRLTLAGRIAARRILGEP